MLAGVPGGFSIGSENEIMSKKTMTLECNMEVLSLMLPYCALEQDKFFLSKNWLKPKKS